MFIKIDPKTGNIQALKAGNLEELQSEMNFKRLELLGQLQNQRDEAEKQLKELEEKDTPLTLKEQSAIANLRYALEQWADGIDKLETSSHVKETIYELDIKQVEI